MRKKVTIANAKPFKDDRGSQPFSIENLHQMAATAAGLPITIDFDDTKPVVGKIISAEVVGEELVADIELREKPFGDVDQYCVPAIKCDSSEMITAAITQNTAVTGQEPI